MHYRNGREAKNGDRVISLAGYGSSSVNINAIGILFDAKPGNDYCNGSIASTIGGPVVGACMCDCLHLDDVAALLVEKGLDKRPGKRAIVINGEPVSIEKSFMTGAEFKALTGRDIQYVLSRQASDGSNGAEISDRDMIYIQDGEHFVVHPSGTF